MPDWTMPLEGGCRCGRVRVRVSAPPLLTSACHCRGCQRMTASAFSLSIAVPDAGFAVTRGETELGGMHGEARHHFCGWCKTWMFSTVEALGPFVNLRAPVLDDRSWFRPYIEMWTAAKLPGVATGAPRSYPEFPAMEDFPAILADYRAWAGIAE
ncbi:GFA family protein [Amaricoccus solimangrovi]|uniref:GFA family protein n=1 Tax=Amaricoccus solimangrovi TaxID=2589815 RepID=A0A501WEZ1_9RHOB|nr:GFA family protein [Amaricoccus solimangrovi]TPE47988.1 GFA family protein [Amaricoccus solimangrovi]